MNEKNIIYTPLSLKHCLPQKGFTVIEIVIAVIVVGILIGGAASFLYRESTTEVQNESAAFYQALQQARSRAFYGQASGEPGGPNERLLSFEMRRVDGVQQYHISFFEFDVNGNVNPLPTTSEPVTLRSIAILEGDDDNDAFIFNFNANGEVNNPLNTLCTTASHNTAVALRVVNTNNILAVINRPEYTITLHCTGYIQMVRN